MKFVQFLVFGFLLFFAQNSLAQSVSETVLVEENKLMDTTPVVQEIPIVKDTLDPILYVDPYLLGCAHGHICCQVGCQCCPEESSIYDIIIQNQVVETKKEKRKKRKKN